jgi:murein DD-endopeptidase MepM/ murein hydrolase activator NlpD
MKYLYILVLLSVTFTSFAQNAKKRNSDDLIFESEEDFTLENNFDGILNFELHKEVSTNPNLQFSQTWDTETCFSAKKRNSFSNVEDTLWLCVGDTVSNEFKIPFDGYVTSHFGPRHGRAHQGIDISLKTGDLVAAAWGGKVRYAKFNKGGYGNLVVIRHYNGLETFYAHLSKLLVVPNQEVKAGDIIGLGGNTGHSFGAHLHFEVRFYDIPINPEHIIDFANKNVKDENVLVHKDLFKVKVPTTPSRMKEVDDEEHNHDGEEDLDVSVEATDVLAGVAVANATATEESVKTTPTPVREARKYHKVKSGESLYKIAKENGITIDKLCQLNGLKQNKTLEVGVTIRIK